MAPTHGAGVSKSTRRPADARGAGRDDGRTTWTAFPLWGPLSVLGLVLAALAFGIDQTFKWWMLSVFDIAGREPVLAAYRHAVGQRYRFFSYGDCMFIE